MSAISGEVKQQLVKISVVVLYLSMIVCLTRILFCFNSYPSDSRDEFYPLTQI
jgi:hypothetical protein